MYRKVKIKIIKNEILIVFLPSDILYHGHSTWVKSWIHSCFKNAVNIYLLKGPFILKPFSET